MELVSLSYRGLTIRLPRGHYTTGVVSARQSWELGVEKYIEDIVAPGFFFVDVGAQFGLFSVLAASRGARVLSVEPRETCCSVIRANAKSLGLDNVEIVNGVVLAPGSCGSVDDTGNYVKSFVPALTLDDILKDGECPDLVKIDVEGCEHQVLEGMRDTVLRCGPTLIIELHSDKIVRLGYSVNLVYDLLEEFHYDWSRMADTDAYHILARRRE